MCPLCPPGFCDGCLVALRWAAVAVLCLSAKEGHAWLKSNPPRTVSTKAIRAGRMLLERPVEAAQKHLQRLDVAAEVTALPAELVIAYDAGSIHWPLAHAPKVVARLLLCETKAAVMVALEEMSE